MTDYFRDSISRIRRQDAWEAAWNNFYNTSTVTSEAPEKADKGYSSRDTLAVQGPGVMRNGDCFIPVIPSAFSDSTGVRLLAGQLEGRPLFVKAPEGIFEYVPKWLKEVRRRDLIDQSERLLSRLKDHIRKDLTQLAQGIVSVISRVSMEALVNLGLVFLQFQGALTRPLKRQFEKMTPVVKSAGVSVRSFLKGVGTGLMRLGYHTLASGLNLVRSALSIGWATAKVRWNGFMALLAS